MNEKLDIDALVALLDDNMAAGSGHLEVIINKDIDDVTINKDLGCTSTACSSPTLTVGLDNKED